MNIEVMFDPALLGRMLEEKFVKTAKHPQLDLRIYNYTASTQFAKEWNTVTRACRGLITDANGNVVARPLGKFFNLSEHPEGSLPTGPVHVTDKVDGSLGILYPTGSGYAIATRGSFTSEQAIHATAVWDRKYAGVFDPRPGWTFLFEIVYPGNRIVVDYSGMDDLVLLAAVDIETGRSVPLEEARAGWPGPVVDEFPHSTLEAALSAPDRVNAEGVVVHFIDGDVRVKVKHDEYVRLHRIVTGVSERRVWEALSSGTDLESWLVAVPDEFFAFVTDTRARLLNEHAKLMVCVEARFQEIMAGMPDGWSRKDFALAVSRLAGWPTGKELFLRLDGADFSHLAWSRIRPERHLPLFSQGEDSN